MHAYPDGRAPGLARVQELGVDGDHLPGRRHQRGHRDAARRREGRQAHRRRRHARHPGRVPRQGPRRAWPRPSSPGCGSAASSSTPRASAGSTAAASPPRRWSILVLAAFVAIGSTIAVSGGRPGLPRPAARPMEQLRVLAGEPLLVIDFRYHLVSLIAVFLAVALGHRHRHHRAQRADLRRTSRARSTRSSRTSARWRTGRSSCRRSWTPPTPSARPWPRPWSTARSPAAACCSSSATRTSCRSRWSRSPR